MIDRIGGAAEEHRRPPASWAERRGYRSEQSAGEEGKGEGNDNDEHCVRAATPTSPTRASRTNADPSLAYVMHKTPNVFPIVGGRKTDHLKGNIEALSIKLSPEDIEEIEDACPFDAGFPLNFLFMGQKTPSGKGSDVFLTKMHAHLDVTERPKPIEPRSMGE